MFRKLFIGRNGPDQLSFALVILSLLLSFVPWAYMFVVTLSLSAVALMRMFSRNIAQRQKENAAFMNLFNKIKSWYYRNKAKAQHRKLYKIFKCPTCGLRLRVPRGKGKVSINCSKCGNKFIRTT